MNLFPITQPEFALSISEEALCLVEVHKAWKTTRFKNMQTAPLPPGTIRLSSAKPNITNMDVFSEQLRILAKPLKKPISVALSLPDLCARTCVFDFSTFPTKAHEQTALLNWRFRQDLKLDTAQSRLAYAAYVPTSLANTSATENPEKVQVLGTAIRTEIVEQYEHACLDLNLMPVSVSIAGLDIFDLYHHAIHEMLEVENRRSPSIYPGAMFLFITHWGFTFFAFHDGCPNFVRTKAIMIRPELDENQWEESEDRTSFPQNTEKEGDLQITGHERLGDTNEAHPYPSYTATKVEKEILATLQFYLETFSQECSTPSLANLFVVSDLEHGHKLLPSPDSLEQTAEVSGKGISDIQVTQLSSSAHFNKQMKCLPHKPHIWSALPGYASLRVA